MPESLNKKKLKNLYDLNKNQCPVERAMRILGGKWKASILYNLKDKPLRFNELSRKLDGASKKVVNDRLQEMKDIGLLKRHVKSSTPIAVEYSITKAGLEALESLGGIRDWAKKNNI